MFARVFNYKKPPKFVQRKRDQQNVDLFFFCISITAAEDKALCKSDGCPAPVKVCTPSNCNGSDSCRYLIYKIPASLSFLYI